MEPVEVGDEGAWYTDKAMLGSLVAACFTAFTVLISALHIRCHLKHYHEPVVQRYTIRILLMVPVYAVNSMISLFTYRTIISFIVNTVRDCYEAYTLYNFLALCLCYVGGPNVLVNRWQSDDYRLPTGLLSMTCCLHDVKLDARFLRLVRQGVIQFIIVKLVLAIIALALEIADKYDEGHFRLDRGFMYVSLLYNASIFVALYALVVFYLSAKPYLAPFKPVAKFALVKTIIFVTFWQAFVIAILFMAGVAKPLQGLDSAGSAAFIQNFLICVESVPIALLNMLGFPVPARDTKASNVVHSLKHFIQMNDVLLDTTNAFDPNYKEFLAVGAEAHDLSSPDTARAPENAVSMPVATTLSQRPSGKHGDGDMLIEIDLPRSDQHPSR